MADMEVEEACPIEFAEHAALFDRDKRHRAHLMGARITAMTMSDGMSMASMRIFSLF
jgi:hypothetical protein